MSSVPGKKKALVTDTLETFGMSQKKSHEVERFSKVIVEVMTRNGLTQVCMLDPTNQMCMHGQVAIHS